VVIAGAGPVGLFCAHALARRGIAVQIVDADWRAATHSYALALHGRSLELLEEAGLLADVLDGAYRVQTVGLYDPLHRRGEMRLTDVGGKFPFVAVMQQNVLEGLMVRALEELGVQVSWNHRVARFTQHADHVDVVVDKLVKDSVGYAVTHTEWLVGKSTELEVPFLIGADGHRSLVRRAMDIPFEEIGPAQNFAVFEFVTDADLEHEMCLVLDDDTTNVLWPLPDGHCRFSFQLGDVALSGDTRRKDRLVVDLGAQRFPALDEERLGRLIEERARWFKGDIGQIDWRMAVRFERRMAASFGERRVWLVGDAGHMTGPVAAQSMNVGLREAERLAELVSEVLGRGAAVDSLGAYGAERLAEWRTLLGVSGKLEPKPDADAWIARRAERLLPCIPASGEELRKLAGQIGLSAKG